MTEVWWMLCLECGHDGETSDRWVQMKLADPSWGHCFCGERNAFVIEKRLKEQD